MLIKNGTVLTSDFVFAKTDLQIENGIITDIGAGNAQGPVLDAEGCYILPGFVDIHTHGCVNSDFCDADASGIEKMLHYYGSVGVTSVVPTTMSFNSEILTDVVNTIVPYFDKDGYGAVLRGINMEGPFINMNKKGAQNAEYIQNPDLAMFKQLYKLSGGRICLVDLAPELAGSLEFISAVESYVTVSIAHTEANYTQACEAFESGASHVTHLYNAMPPFTHRDPGVVGAAFDFAAHVELIADGIHLHPAVVRATFAMFGSDRICLISDSMRATGMPNGMYSLGGQPVQLRDGKATLEDGTIAGSAVNLAEVCRRTIQFGIPIEQAVKAASFNNAVAAGLEDVAGSIQTGRRADLQIWNPDLTQKCVLCGGTALT